MRAVFESQLGCSSRALYDYHACASAFGRLLPPWDRVELVGKHPGLVNGSVANIVVRRGPLALPGAFEHSNVIEGSEFTDTQLKGPFRRWRHRHRFVSNSGDPYAPGCRLIDDIEFDLPDRGVLSGGFIRAELLRLFRFRHDRTKRDLARIAWWRSLAKAPITVAVSGATGTIGGPLCDSLTMCGVRVLRLVRSSQDVGPDQIAWRSPEGNDPGSIDASKLEGVDAVIHLAGEPITGERWSAQKKDRIRTSRVEGTRLVARALAAMASPPQTFIVAGGISYYGERGNQEVTEETGVGSGFRAEVARDWESAADPARQAGLRVINLRFGAVLSSKGGILSLINPLFSLGLGGVPGTGAQQVSWIGIDDTVGAIMHALVDDKLVGPVNVTAPNPVRMDTLAGKLAAAHGRSPFARIPVWAVRAMFSERAEVLLESCRVMPAKLLQHGFRFEHPDIISALRNELGRHASSEMTAIFTR